MFTFLEERDYQEAHKKLLTTQLKVNNLFQRDEARIEASSLTEEERSNYLNLIISNYDQNMARAELEYDLTMDKLRPWKKPRKESRKNV